MLKSIPSKRICGLEFSTYSPEDIFKMSVKEITNPQTFDTLLHPTNGGLYDSSLGPSDYDDSCDTCSLDSIHCPGHFGHIRLPMPVYNPMFFRLLFQILRGSCLHCCHLLANRGKIIMYKYQLLCLDYGLIAALENIEDIYIQTREKENDKNSDSFMAVLSERMQEFIDKALKDINKEEAKRNSRVRNVYQCRYKLIKNFMKEEVQFKTKCNRCKQRVQKLKTEYNSKIFSGKSNLAPIKITKQNNGKRLQSQQEESQEILEDEEDFENKEVNEDLDGDKEAMSGDGTDSEENKVEEEETEENDLSQVESLQSQLKKYNQVYITPSTAKEVLGKLFENEGSFLSHLFGIMSNASIENYRNPVDLFFLDYIIVPPSRFRPLSVIREKKFENPQTANLKRVLETSLVMKRLLKVKRKRAELFEKDTHTMIDSENGKEVHDKKDEDAVFLAGIRGDTFAEKLNNLLLKMQTFVNCLMDSELDKLSKEKIPGIKQLLEKKEGLFRKHMMGKRVNYAARSVISPDFNIATNEIGIPAVIAKKLTYPQPVTPSNVKELRQMVINGPNEYPGALMVECEDGFCIRLRPSDQTQREAVAKQLLTPSSSTQFSIGSKKVHRHLMNGDILLLNRQPTLHKPSIMAHKARVLPGEKTLRLHYANCKSYNADFDGDEMNVHFPQNELGRSEAYHLASTNFQYLTPKDGTPLAGLIQDHMVSGVSLTLRGRFFNRNDYQKLIYCALTDKQGQVKLLPPCLIKPCQLWSGKQVLSTVLLNTIPKNTASPLNYVGKAKIDGKNWITVKPTQTNTTGKRTLKENEMSESEVIFRGGELVSGVLDKAHYGNTPFGLMHCCYELYGGVVTGMLLTCFGKLFATFLQTMLGFTLGVEDILIKSKADKKRKQLMQEASECGHSVAVKALELEREQCENDRSVLEEALQDAQLNPAQTEMKELDLYMKVKTDHYTNEINKVCMPNGLYKQFPRNNLQLMVQSGAKGTQVNCMQISCLLGQIELEGRRPPLMASGRSLPCFLPYDTSPRAGGFVDGRFLTGIKPPEYFFHCMAGREGLVDTAVKTSRSGYLQRCIIKHLEGLVVGYDMTVRDSDSSVVQFQYGEDGLEIPMTPFLKLKQFPFLINNSGALLHEEQLQHLFTHVDTQKGPALQKKIDKWKRKFVEGAKGSRITPFQYFSQKNLPALMEKNNTKLKNGISNQIRKELVKMWASCENKRKYEKHCPTLPDPVLSQVRADLHFGAVSEKFSRIVQGYCTENPDGLICGTDSDHRDNKISPEKFQSLMNLKYMRALCQPGEAVGLLAAQSIGEPSTQMTLNTFHFAGRGEMNVTLGIPRLREILMVGSQKIKTPTMDVQILPTRKAQKKAQRLKKRLTSCILSEVLEDVSVEEYFDTQSKSDLYKVYVIKMVFLPSKNYEEEMFLNPATILNRVETLFFQTLIGKIRNASKHDTTGDPRLIETNTKSTTLNDDLDDLIETVVTKNPSGLSHSDEEEEDEDEFPDDGDATTSKMRHQHNDDAEYEDDEGLDEDDMKDSEEDEEESDEEKEESVNSDSSEPEYSYDMSRSKKKRKKSKDEMLNTHRVKNVLILDRSIIDYAYDVENELWCQISIQLSIKESNIDMCSLVTEVAKKFVIQKTPGISRAFITESSLPTEEGIKRLKTEGVNLPELFAYSNILDLNRLYTNDIHAMAKTYGIEAACRIITKEIREVFKAYGIEVDPRHLSLIADYMTFEGNFKAFNRYSLESNASPLQKMSFEKTLAALREATVNGAHDDLKSPSACLVVGRLVKGGTGCFDLLQPLVTTNQ